jgi:hypothetical protein
MRMRWNLIGRKKPSLKWWIQILKHVKRLRTSTDMGTIITQPLTVMSNAILK